MRRIAIFLAAAGVLSLSACGGAGSVLSTGTRNTANQVVITVVGPSNIPRVLPGASLPLSATATIGPQNGTSTIDRFRWSATLLTSGSYVVNTSGGTKSCSVVTQTTGATTQPYGADMSIDVTIDPTNEANILFTPPPALPAPAGSTLTTNYPYCVQVTASALTGSDTNPQIVASGSITVAVVNPLSPEQ